MNKFSDLKGKVLLAHKQECCETVAIDDINGKLSDLAGNYSESVDWERISAKGEK